MEGAGFLMSPPNATILIGTTFKKDNINDLTLNNV